MTPTTERVARRELRLFLLKFVLSGASSMVDCIGVSIVVFSGSVGMDKTVDDV